MELLRAHSTGVGPALEEDHSLLETDSLPLRPSTHDTSVVVESQPTIGVAFDSTSEEEAALVEDLKTAFERRGASAVPIAFNEVAAVIATDGSIAYYVSSERIPPIDFLLNRLGADITRAQRGMVEAIADTGAVVYPNPDAAIRSANKHSAITEVAGLVNCPRTLLTAKPFDEDFIRQHLGPVENGRVYKTVSGSCGKTVWIARNADEALALCGHPAIKEAGLVLVQPFIGRVENGRVSDVRVFIAGGEAVAYKRVGPKGDYRANVSNGGATSPIQLTPELEEASRLVASVIGLNLICGVDWLIDNDGDAVFCEINAAPGWFGLCRAHPEFDPAGKIADAVLQSLRS